MQYFRISIRLRAVLLVLRTLDAKKHPENYKVKKNKKTENE